jgi:hypothetical protein
MAKISQMRTYTINRGEMDTWVDFWKTKVLPIRLKLGFTVDGAWVIPDENKFVWILSYDGPEDWEAKTATYFESPERAALKPSPSEFIANIQAYFINAVLEP